MNHENPAQHTDRGYDQGQTVHDLSERHPLGRGSIFARLAAARRERRTQAAEVSARHPLAGNLRWRDLSSADTPALISLIKEVEESENPPFRTTAQEVRELFDPGYRIACRGGFDDDGLLRAYALVRVAEDELPYAVATLSGAVHPVLRDQRLGRDMLQWQIEAGKAILVDLDRDVPAYIQVHVESGQEDIADMLQRHGFSEHGVVTQLRGNLQQTLPPLNLPAHIRLEPWRPELDTEVRRAHDAAFAQSESTTTVNDAEWARVAARVMPQWSYVAMDRSTDRPQVAGYVLASQWEEDWEALGWTEGYIEALGVRKEWRGQGVAIGLLTSCMKSMAASGMQYVGLDTDSATPTGASVIFEALHFEPTHTTRQYILAL